MFKVNKVKYFRQGRSNSKSISVASGGNQRKFESVVSLWRKNNGLFDQPLQQGGAVRLGDELMLRTVVREGDGKQKLFIKGWKDEKANYY